MGFIDRILTIVITATLTSVVWIVAGGSIIENTSSMRGADSVRPAEAAPSPSPSAPSPSPSALPGEASGPKGEDPDLPEATGVADSLHEDDARSPRTSDNRTMVVPVMNVRPSDLTDTFTKSQAAGSRLHEAIDIMAPEGTSVISAAPGTIEKMFVSEAGGKAIYVRSQDRETILYYAHLAEYAKGLKEGQKVRRGQRLGTVGSSGNASADAPHLHFAMLRTTADAAWWEPANAINPYPFLVK